MIDNYSTILNAIERINQKIDNMQEDIKSLHIITEKYKDVVLSLNKRLDTYEDTRDNKCFTRIAKIENDAKDVQHEIKALSEKASENKKTLIEMTVKCVQFDSFMSNVSEQLADIKEIISKNEKEIQGIHKRLDAIGWVSDIGSHFKKVIIALIVAMFVASVGLLTVGSKLILQTGLLR